MTAAATPIAPPAPGAAPQLTLENASQADSLDQLAGVGEQLQGGAPGADGAAPGQAGPLQAPTPNAVLIADTLRTARETFCAISDLKAPRATLTDAHCKQMGELWGTWCDKRGISLGKYLGDHHDTYLAALATAGLAWAVYSATVAEIRVRRPVDVKAKPGQDDAAAAAPVSPAGPKPPADTTATFVGGSAA